MYNRGGDLILNHDGSPIDDFVSSTKLDDFLFQEERTHMSRLP